MIAMSIPPQDAVRLKDIGPKLPGKPAYYTLLTWWKVGKKNRITGETVRLEVIRMPCGYCTSREAYDRFLAALNEGMDG